MAMNDVTSHRAGRYVQQPEGFKAFLPNPLPPSPAVTIDGRLPSFLSKADRALGRLDGASSVLPNPDLFVAMYVRKEAVLSSQIEGTQASLIDVVEYEAQPGRHPLRDDIGEVVNYVRAMNCGLARLGELPLCLRLLREIHAELMAGARGSERDPGEFRRSQNWIGPPGGAINDAVFVPPPVHEMAQALGNLETYLHKPSTLPPLINCGLVHAQFETIHPFLDGNGRMGRLLITFMLCHEQILQRPVLYLSYYLKKNRGLYYDKLMAVRHHGGWEGWLEFFLQGIAEVAEQATDTARRVLDMQQEHREVVANRLSSKGKTLLLDRLYKQPVVSANDVSRICDVSVPTARRLISAFEQVGLLREITGRSYRRLFMYGPYMDILREGTEPNG